jgi:rare lipoprotein A (peptidoglycan hydrolase)
MELRPNHDVPGSQERAGNMSSVIGLFGRLVAIVSVTIVSQNAMAAQVSNPHKRFSGKASYYSIGQKTASGARFDPAKLTAAHRTLPFGTRVRVTEPRGGKSVVVTVNDRGPFIKERVLDLSLGAARLLGMTGRGIMHIVAEVAPDEPEPAAPVSVGVASSTMPKQLAEDRVAYD